MEVAEDDDVEYFREEVGVLPDKGITVVFKMEVLGLFHYGIAEPHSSVGSVADFRTGGHWFNPSLSQYSFRGLMIIIVTGFIPLSPLSIVLTMVIWEAASGLERILCGVLVKDWLP